MGSSYTCRKMRAQTKKENRRKFSGYFTNLPKLKPFPFLTFQPCNYFPKKNVIFLLFCFNKRNLSFSSSLTPIFLLLKLTFFSPKKAKLETQSALLFSPPTRPHFFSSFVDSLQVFPLAPSFTEKNLPPFGMFPSKPFIAKGCMSPMGASRQWAAD